MSKPRYNWWPFALNMIRDYQARSQQYHDLHEQKTTARASEAPGGGGDFRTVERIAIRELPRQEQLEYDAVRKAEDLTRLMKDGDIRLRVAGLTIMRDLYTIPGVAMRLDIPENMAKRYRWEFILTVGFTYGLINKEEYDAATKKKNTSPPRAKKVC